MKICEDYHTSIVHDASQCPICAMSTIIEEVEQALEKFGEMEDGEDMIKEAYRLQRKLENARDDYF